MDVDVGVGSNGSTADDGPASTISSNFLGKLWPNRVQTFLEGVFMRLTVSHEMAGAALQLFRMPIGCVFVTNTLLSLGQTPDRTRKPIDDSILNLVAGTAFRCSEKRVISLRMCPAFRWRNRGRPKRRKFRRGQS